MLVCEKIISMRDGYLWDLWWIYGCVLMLTFCWKKKNKGWSGHPVCRKRYHFIIRAASDAVEAYQRPCSRCGNLLQLSETR